MTSTIDAAAKAERDRTVKIIEAYKAETWALVQKADHHDAFTRFDLCERNAASGEILRRIQKDPSE